ncbi:PREDICTED: uncharacterized protein LOC104763169 [Camelina sativa]|uniref:Uncharacterized protein LOC104763169 n=1 Tax=Camelina sativa TaxID=90675 RepID=A0ABM0XET3_CAMSA|nr:PREDICTED: uncharacterized protein LOC104763169 [Camelina sativa]
MTTTESFSSAPLSISQVVTLKLIESNYLLWKNQFESFLSPQLLLGYVNGSISRLETTRSVTGVVGVTIEPNPDFTKWVRNDQLVVAWIFSSLSEPALRVVYGMQSSQEVSTALANKFNRVSTTRKFELQNRLRVCIKLGRTMEEYLSELKQIFDQLDSIGFPMTDLEKIHASSVTPQSSYFDRGGSGNRGGRSGGGYKGRGNYSTRGRGFQQHGRDTPGQDGQHKMTGSSKPTCQISGKYGHSAHDCYNRFNEDYVQQQATVLAAMRIFEGNGLTNGTEWLPDSGSTAHITNSTANLQQIS